VRLAGSVLGTGRHVCAFFSNDDDHSRTLMLSSRKVSNEASTNLRPLEDPVVCAYDLRKFRRDMSIRCQENP
jgi:hypothetical protein